jgi:hypothetical protein
VGRTTSCAVDRARRDGPIAGAAEWGDRPQGQKSQIIQGEIGNCHRKRHRVSVYWCFSYLYTGLGDELDRAGNTREATLHAIDNYINNKYSAQTNTRATPRRAAVRSVKSIYCAESDRAACQSRAAWSEEEGDPPIPRSLPRKQCCS